MSNIGKLNNAILRIKGECASHESCAECPMKIELDNGSTWCKVDPSPNEWEEIEEEDNGKD